MVVGERKILVAVAQYGTLNRQQLTVLTGYKRSSRDTYLQRLQAKTFLDVAGSEVRITPAGLAVLGGDYEPLPIGQELQRYWLARLPEGERKILEVLLRAYPRGMERERMSEQTEYRRSSRDTYLQRLRARGLVEFIGRGEVRAHEALFEVVR